MVSYSYDVWGKPISKTGTLANTLGKLNPFRYRGYIFDEETGLYYLRSRYYNPNLCRFINTDDVEAMGADGDINGYELVHLQVNGETITTTVGHPFFVHGKGWVAAKELVVGDRLTLFDDSEASIDEISTEEFVKPVKVYNFEVEDFHTYFVWHQYHSGS